jgi:DNA-binding CsgD family transcriptional regulator
MIIPLSTTDLTPQDVSALLQTIYKIYELKNPETFGRDSLVLIEQLVPTEVAALIRQATGPSLYQGAEFQSLDPAFEHLMMVELSEFLTKHTQYSPFIKHIPMIVQGGAHKFSDFGTREELLALEGVPEIIAAIRYDDHMVMAVCGEVLYRDPLVYYYFYRYWGTWTERDRLLLNLLQPHLIQAYRTVMHCQRQQTTIDQLQQSLDRTGTIFLNKTGQPQSITSEASRWLRDYFPGVQSPRRLPDTLQSWVDHQLAQLQRTDPYPALLPLRIQQSERQLTIRFTIDQPNQSYLLLLAEEQLLSPLAALELLGLSRREAEALLGVVQGQDNPAIAQTLGISVGTVRKHIENIYRKLDVQSRSEAVSLVIQKLGGLNTPPICETP